MPETVTLRRGASNGAELRIELNRPETMNAWDRQFGEELRAAVEEAAADDSVRSVTITGAGRGARVSGNQRHAAYRIATPMTSSSTKTLCQPALTMSLPPSHGASVGAITVTIGCGVPS